LNIHTIPLVILIAYVIFTLIVANVVLRRRLGAEHYLVAGRALPAFLVLAVVLGDWLGGGSTVGVCQRSYNEGIVGWIYPLSISIALLVFAFTMASRYRRLKAVTVPEVVGRVFDTKTRLASAIVVGVAYYVIAVTQVTAGGALLSPLLGVDKWLADLIAAAIFIAVISAGGLASVALVNIIQCGVIYLGMLLALFFSLASIGGGSVSTGFSMLFTELPSSFWSFGAISPVTWAGEVLAVVFSCFAAQAAVTGVFAAKDDRAAARGTWLAGILILPIGVTFVLLGMCAKVHFGTALPFGLEAGPAMILALTPVIAGFGLCGLFAAIVSTGPLCFLAPTQILIRDVYSAYINPNASDKKLLLYSRVVAIVLIIIGWVLSVTLYDVLKTIFWAFALRSGIGVILLAVTYIGSKRVSEDGAFWGLIAGFIALVAWTIAGSPYGIHVAMPAIVVIFMASLVISRFRKRKAEFSPEVEAAIK
jgi:SSS family solute:Na+ symporter